MLVGDGADEAIDLFKAEDNVVLIGELAVILACALGVLWWSSSARHALTEKVISTKAWWEPNKGRQGRYEPSKRKVLWMLPRELLGTIDTRVYVSPSPADLQTT